MVQTKSSESANRGQQIAPVLSGHSSPRPWNNSTADETQICDRDGYDIATTFLGAGDYDENYMTRAGDAALIVRAVNSHEALVRALEEATKWFSAYQNASPSNSTAATKEYKDRLHSFAKSAGVSKIGSQAVVDARAALAGAK